ncbi:MAG: glycoside hydrolase family 25 protein [Flavobacteriales bacterium]
MKKPLTALLGLLCIVLYAQEAGTNNKISTALNLVICNNDTQELLTRQYTHDSCPTGVKPIMLIENIGVAEIDSRYIKPDYILDNARIESGKKYLMDMLPVEYHCPNGMTIYTHKLFNFLSSELSSENYCRVAQRLRSEQSFKNLVFKSPPVVQEYTELNRISNALSEVMNNYPGYIGIDVSHHQQEINWGAVSSIQYPRPIKFVIMKATEGGTFRDKRFEENWKKAREYDLTRGAYHFYRPDADPYEQAKNYITQVGHLNHKDMIPVIDLEKPCSKCSDLMGPHFDYMKNLKIFVQQIKNHYGTKVLFYSGNNYYYDYIKGYFPDDYFWLARYSSNQKPHDLGFETVGWQFTDRMKLQGIGTSVDTNYFLASQFENLRVGTSKKQHRKAQQNVLLHDEIIEIEHAPTIHQTQP